MENLVVSRSISQVPPSHFLLKIQTFSSLVENDVESYESSEFDVGSHKWKLVVYPKGNKNKNVKDHISLYLAMVDTSSFGFGWEVSVIFRLSVLDQNKDKFLIPQDAMGNERRFHGVKLEWGFDQFIPLQEFNDSSNGYLVGDTCVFGAEVFVKERNVGKGECLSMTKLTSASIYRHVWKIENFSKLEPKLYVSDVFVAGNQKWRIRLYPKGQGEGSGTHVSMYLALADSSTITRGSNIYVHFTLRIWDQLLSKDIEKKFTKRFITAGEDCGSSKFVELSYLNRAGSGFLVNNVCFVEAVVPVLGISGAL